MPGFWRPWTETGYQDAYRLKIWQGAPKRVEESGYVDPRPCEPAEDGCPGGWSRCGYASSFAQYIRPRLGDGSHDSNPRIGPTTAAHILDALRFFETHQARAENEFTRKAR